MRRRWLGVVLLVASAFLASPPASAQADLALVMAVDVSASVNDERFALQRDGVAKGLESQAVFDAIAAGAHRTIELAIIEWSEEQNILVGWTVIRSRDDLRPVVEALRTGNRPRVGWKTSVGDAIAKAAALFDSAPLKADRRVIDVSGDGQQNSGKLAAAHARDEAVAGDITINGLPITSGEEPDVDGWYRAHVVGGAGAFMIVATGHDNFSDAMRMKLSLEVAGKMPPVRYATLR